MAWNWKKIGEFLKGAGEVGEVATSLAEIFQLKKLGDTITNVVGGMAKDATKVTLNKRFHKREYGKAFTKLSRKERDAVRAIHTKLRQKKCIENFMLNVALYGDNMEDSTELLRTLAQYSPNEAWQLIDDMDLEKEPVHRTKDVLRIAQQALNAARRTWNQVDAEVATTLNATARSIDRARRRWTATNFGIDEPFYHRLQRPSLGMMIIVCLILLVVILTTAGIHAYFK